MCRRVVQRRKREPDDSAQNRFGPRIVRFWNRWISPCLHGPIHRSWCWEMSSTCILPVYIILVLVLNHYSGNVVICGIWLVSIDSPKMIDRGRSKFRQFCRTFTCLRYDPQALSGLRLVSLFLSSVGKISRLYSAKSTWVSTVCRECCMSGSSVSTDMKNIFKCLL